MFQRRHYEAIATTLASVRPLQYGDRRVMWTSAVMAFANMFADDNSNFDRSRFFEACDNR